MVNGESINDLSVVRSPRELPEIAAQIREELDALAGEIKATIERSIRIGELLLSCRDRVPLGEWEKWIAENLPNCHQTWINKLIRIAYYQDEVRTAGYQTMSAAELGLRHMPALWRRGLIGRDLLDARALRDQGWSQRRIAERYGVTQASVSRAFSPTSKSVALVARRKRERAGKLALERQERDKAAKRVGGGISEAYSLVRKAAQILDRLSRDGETDAIRKSANDALRRIHYAEDNIVEMIGLPRASWRYRRRDSS